jgi:autotransporter-associated beta strand protein
MIPNRLTKNRLRSLPLVLPLAFVVVLVVLLRQPSMEKEPADSVVSEREPTVASKPRIVDTAPIEAFDAWLDAGPRADSADQGLELARARREAMKELIRSDPKAALERAVPYADRRRLPARVVNLLEIPVSTTTDFEAEIACGLPGGRSFRQQWITLDGERIRAFTYGQRAEVMTKQKLSVHGIAIDDVMAMLDDPLREWSAQETADHGHTGRIAQLGKRLLAIESDEALATARQQLRAAEETLGPFALHAYRDLALGNIDGMAPIAMGNGGGSNDDDLPPIAFSAQTEGLKKILYIRARFANEPSGSEPISDTAATTNQTAAEAFWLENSYGKSSLETTYTSVITLPKIGSAYVGDFATLLKDAREAALAANSLWDYEKFDFYTVITNDALPPSSFGYIGFAQLNNKGSHLLSGFTTIRTASHEYGHNLGLNHSEYWLTDSPSPIGRDSVPGGYAGDNPDDERIEYGHKFAVMGSQNGSGDFEVGRAHYTASDKNRLDWLAAGDIATTTSSGNIRLYRHDVPASQSASRTLSVARAIKIDLPASDPSGLANPYKYWLNYRMLPTDGIAGSWLPFGLQVDWRRDSGGFRSVMLDMTPYSRDSGPYGATPGMGADNNDKEDGVLLVGRTFSDTGADIHFTPIARGGSSPNEWLDVVVNIGSQNNNDAPVISNFTVNKTNPATGEVINFAVTVSDPDGDTLAYHWDVGDNTVQSGQLNLPTRGKQWSTPGYHVVRCEVSDMKGGKTSATRVIAVGSPANNGIWTNASGGSWGATTNWSGNNIAGGEGNTADFSTLNPGADTTVNLDAARAIGNLIFGDTNTGSAATWFLANGSGGSLILAGTSPTITVNPLGSGKFANIIAQLAGFNGFTKTGTGNLLLNNAANTLSGPIILNAGNLQLNNASLTNASSVAINAGNLVVATSAANAIGGTISFGGGTLQYNVNPGTDYSAQFSTAASQPYRVSITSGREVTFNSELASPGGTLTKLNAGKLTLTAANSYSGGTNLSAGIVNIAHATALGSGDVSFSGNATLQAGGTHTVANALSVASGFTGTLDTNGNNLTLGGILTGSGSLTKTGSGTLNISGGGSSNSLSGPINVTAGTLAIDNVNPNPAIQSFAGMNGDITVASGATFNFSQSFTAETLENDILLSGSGDNGLGALNLWRNATATGTITLAADATISHDFNTATISGGISGTDRNLTLKTLTTGTPQPGMTVSGPIALGTGGVTVQGVANSGPFSIRLSGNNSYSGETRVVSGTLMITGNARIPDASAVRIDPGAVLHLDFAGTDMVAGLSLNGVAKPNGTYGSPTSSAANRSSDFLGNGILRVGPANDYASWAGDQMPPVSGGPNGDHDGDGVKNLVEYALEDGGERGVFSGNTLTFTKRGAPYGGDLSYIIETSGTLEPDSWSTVVTHGPAELGQTIGYTFTPDSPGKQFARLKVVLATAQPVP